MTQSTIDLGDRKVKVTTIALGMMDRESAEVLRGKIDGKTYMKFELCAAPCGGSWNVWAQTDYDAPEAEILAFFLGFIASAWALDSQRV